ncbi:MAG: histidine kinase [Balneolales bacterium]|nr:histidine kinase [Balneolales bacterium]
MNKTVLFFGKVLIACALVWFSDEIPAQTVFSGHDFVVTQFGMEEGLPQSSVNDIIQTKDGYIWLATFGGLVRFDGQTFTTYNRFNTEGMISDRLTKLYEDQEGGIWVISENLRPFLMRFKDGVISSYPFDVNSGTTVDLGQDKLGNIWYSAYNEVFRFTGETFEPSEISTNSIQVQQALNDTMGVWLPGRDKIYKTLGDSVILMEENTDATYGRFINHIHEYPKHSGNFFYGTDGGGIIYKTRDGDQRFTIENGLPSRFILDFEFFPNGVVFGELFNAIVYWNGSEFVEFPTSYFPSDTQFKSMLIDNEGNYWVGTSARGLFRLQERVITMIDAELGLGNDIMLSLTKLRNGNMLFSTNCGGIYEWDGVETTYSAIHEYFKSYCNWSVFEDSKSRIWIGSRGLYLTESLNEPGRYFTEEDGFTGVSIFSIFEDSDENIWVGAQNGVFKYDDSLFTYFSTEDGLYHNTVRTIYEDKEGTIWVGSAGLHKIVDGKVEKIELLDTSNFDLVEQPQVRSIYQDADGAVWIGTYGNGLFRYKDGEVVQLTVNDGLFDNIISHIVEDEFGNFWMGSNRGISRVLSADLNDFINGNIPEINAYSFGAKDGMNSSETNGGFQPNAVVDDEMNIYFPTVAGVAVVNTRKVTQNSTPPPVFITGLRTSEGQVPLEESISLPYGTPFLEIDYTAVNFTDPDNVNFRYKLENLNQDWIEVGNRREALYSSIPPGIYTFRVIASNSDRVWNEVGDSFELTIIPPFWMTTWFYSVLGLLFISGGFGMYYIRVQQLKKENEKQRRFSQQLIDSQEKERRRIASELHDGLGQQILVIKNRAEIAHQLMENPGEVAEQLDQIRDSAQVSISDVRKIAHNLRPVLLENLGLKEALLSLFNEIEETSEIEWEFEVGEVDDLIPKEKEINLFRVVQESIKNIEVHSEASKASIRVKVEKKGIHSEIMDDGKGVDEKLIKESNGMGVAGMNERVKSLGGELFIRSNIPSGTIVSFKIPLE